MICKPEWSGEAKPSSEFSRGDRPGLGNLTRFEERHAGATARIPPITMKYILVT